MGVGNDELDQHAVEGVCGNEVLVERVEAHERLIGAGIIEGVKARLGSRSEPPYEHTLLAVALLAQIGGDPLRHLLCAETHAFVEEAATVVDGRPVEAGVADDELHAVIVVVGIEGEDHVLATIRRDLGGREHTRVDGAIEVISELLVTRRGGRASGGRFFGGEEGHLVDLAGIKGTTRSAVVGHDGLGEAVPDLGVGKAGGSLHRPGVVVGHGQRPVGGRGVPGEQVGAVGIRGSHNGLAVGVGNGIERPLPRDGAVGSAVLALVALARAEAIDAEVGINVARSKAGGGIGEERLDVGVRLVYGTEVNSVCGDAVEGGD
mmetsp:Transcript_38327/g.120986  ORF Transcript_38327/g.120986 Transcript_38327/m.120986 type:complete len:320 (+) Transcript_38327:274-1233(+)